MTLTLRPAVPGERWLAGPWAEWRAAVHPSATDRRVPQDVLPQIVLCYRRRCTAAWRPEGHRAEPDGLSATTGSVDLHGWRGSLPELAHRL